MNSMVQNPGVQEEECPHDLARPQTRGGKEYYYCFECDSWIDPETMEAVPEPPEDGESHAGKAQAPQPNNLRNGSGAPKPKSQPTMLAQKPRRQERDESKMVTVQCQHKHPETGEQCQRLFRVWPQNAALVQYCPQFHRAQHKRELNRQRQKAFRNRQT